MREKGRGDSAVFLTFLKYGRPIGDLPVKLLFTTWVKVMKIIFQRTMQIPLPSLTLYPLDLTSHEVSGQPSPTSCEGYRDWCLGCGHMDVPRGNFEPLSALSLREDRRYSRHSQTVTNQPLRKTEPVSQYTLSFLSSLKLFVNK